MAKFSGGFKSYRKICKKCEEFYLTKHKISNLCDKCRSDKVVKQTCPVCGVEKQYGDSKELCPHCRERKKIYELMGQ